MIIFFRTMALALGLGVMVTCGCLAAQPGIPPLFRMPRMPAHSLLTPGTDAPDFTGLTYSGGNVSLSDYRGKIVVVEFWATWSAPCAKQLLLLQHVYNTYKKDDVVAIALCVLDSTSNANTWIEKHPQFNFIVALDPAGRTTDSITAPYQVSQIPTTYVIDQSGKVAAAETAMSGSDLAAAIHALIPAVQPIQRAVIPEEAKHHAPIQAGEILLHGLVTDDPDSTGAFPLSAVWATLPNGATILFDSARTKVVLTGAQTSVNIGGAASSISGVKQGMEVDVYGRDQGVGKPLSARLITAAGPD